jgi:SAM-dependent methyltransferase
MSEANGLLPPRAASRSVRIGRVSDDYRTINRANWDERAPAHAASPGYEVADLVADANRLSGVVSFDRPLLGDISGKRGVHLQCHIGTDTVSLSRLGATMTGLDFSPAALLEARRIAQACGQQIEFVHSDVFDAVPALGEGQFDLVYTGIGAIGWLPDIARWARVVSDLLVPGGRLFMREGHPMLFTLADARPDRLLVVDHPYFERAEPTVWDEPGTYVETDQEFRHTVTHEWAHGLGEVVTALLNAGMELTGLAEHQSVPWQALEGQMVPIGGGEYQLDERPWRLPHSYTVQAVKG